MNEIAPKKLNGYVQNLMGSLFSFLKPSLNKHPKDTVEQPPPAPEPAPRVILTQEEEEELFFGATRHIEDWKLLKLARDHLASELGEQCWILDKLEGSFNRVHIIQFNSGSKYVVRVPAWERLIGGLLRMLLLYARRL